MVPHQDDTLCQTNAQMMHFGQSIEVEIYNILGITSKLLDSWQLSNIALIEFMQLLNTSQH